MKTKSLNVLLKKVNIINCMKLRVQFQKKVIFIIQNKRTKTNI